MIQIPLQAVPSQTFQVNLNGQQVTINLYQKSTGLFLDLLVNGDPVITGVQCVDRVRIVRDAYLGFVGDLCFVDTQGDTDPVYTGLGTQYILVYLQPGDY